MCKRKITKYDPLAELRAEYPGWLFATVALNGLAELLCADGQLAFIDPVMWPDVQFAWAHVAAHLREGHHLETGDCIAGSEEDIANFLAELRLDRDEFRDTLTM